ncbi:hypothetical protein Pgy4_40912, partial [Pseudomonas savastanoi pv. glycinea str. race 4]
ASQICAAPHTQGRTQSTLRMGTIGDQKPHDEQLISR